MGSTGPSGQTAGKYSQGDFVAGGFRRGVPTNQATPSLVTFMNDLRSVFLVLSLPRECKRVFGLSIGC